MKNSSLSQVSCPLSQNGWIRIISQPAHLHTCIPAYLQPVPLKVAIQTLQIFCKSAQPQVWRGELSLLNAAVFDHSKIHGHRQLTNVYLLALAVKHQACFVSFDGTLKIALQAGLSTEQPIKHRNLLSKTGTATLMGFSGIQEKDSFSRPIRQLAVMLLSYQTKNFTLNITKHYVIGTFLNANHQPASASGP